ncbi:MAG: LysR family transcriptional regulator, partial [Fischerella sp.]|nr:LysR family transcriptional regulator [Fischerella sp.]
VLHCTPIEGVIIKRTLWLIFNPNRYRSKAAEAFSREILPQFAAPGWNVDVLKSSQNHRSLVINTTVETDGSHSDES